MVEYSEGYLTKNREASRVLKDSLSPRANAVNLTLRPYFEKSATRAKDGKHKPADAEAAA